MQKDNPLINGNICEIDGAYYPVVLKWIPRPGELINLFSFLDQASDHPHHHDYEVVHVVHELHDIAKGEERSQTGHHFVQIYVKPSQHKFLK